MQPQAGPDGDSGPRTVAESRGAPCYTTSRRGVDSLLCASDVTRLTDRVGYDGGPFYSRDGTKIVLRSSFPETEEEKAEYLAFLKDGLVVPSALAITVMDRNGKNSRWVTDNGKANFAPFFHPDKAHPVRQQPGRPQWSQLRDLPDRRGRPVPGAQVTFNPTFDRFPMFSPNAIPRVCQQPLRHRASRDQRFVAEWVEPAEQD